MRDAPALERLRARARTGATLAAVGLGFSLPISSAFDGVFLALALLLWLLSLPPWSGIRRLRQNPVALACLGLFALCAIGLAYGGGPLEHGLMYLKKYMDLALVPLFVLLFQEARARAAAIRAFEIAMLVTLAVSCLLAAGVLPPGEPFRAGPLSGASAFKLQITHGIFMAFAAFLYAVRARSAPGAAGRFLWSAASALAAANVLFMVIGRTGYLVLFALAAVFCWRMLAPRGRRIAAALAIAVLAAGISVPGKFADRVRVAIDEARAWEYGGGAGTSVGDRLNFYATSLGIWRENPVFGTGLRGYPGAFARHTAGTGIAATHNPHNQFLLFAAQLGAAGLAAFLALLWTLWRNAPKIADERERLIAQALVATLAVSSAFNSFLLDHSEGLFFAWLTGLAYSTLGRGRESTAR